MTKNLLSRWVIFCLGLLMVLGLVGAPVLAEAAVDQLATASDLRHQAFQALRAGEFDRTNTLLARAAELNPDSATRQMANWAMQFENRRQEFASQRREQFEKAVADVRLLLDNGHPDFALESVARAYLLADDKDAFRAEKWVDDLIQREIVAARDYEARENWVRALWVYSALGSIEPANPQWKHLLKQTTRRIRMLALYAPDYLEGVQDHETAERDEVTRLLKPTTQPVDSTQPTADGQNDPTSLASQGKEQEDDTFRIDWRESLKDIKIRMLEDALHDTYQNYWRDVTYRDLLLGGLRDLEIFASTRGLETTFPLLGNESDRQTFVAGLQQLIDQLQSSTTDDAASVARVLGELEGLNARTLKLDEPVLVSEFADGAFGTLDPFSSIIWPTDLEEFQKTTQGEFSGVGIQIQTGEDGSLKVVSPLEDSPAYRAGIKAGDIITHIDGRSARGITLNQAVKTITGRSGTIVVLTIRSADNTSKDYSIVRQTIKMASVKGWQHLPGGGWDYFIDPQNRISYVRVTNFTKTTADDLAAAFKEMKAQHAQGVIMDLRYNPGGLLQSATEVVDRFINSGTIVSTRADRSTPNPPTIASAHEEGDELDLPVVVLVNQYSASASEIVSGALKDHKRALVIGERTFGKGSVQMLFPLSSRRAYLKLTTSHYYLPGGESIHRDENSQRWGVDPDVTIEMTPEQMRVAIEARQELDILRDADQSAADQSAAPTTRPDAVNLPVEDQAATRKDPLQSDPQLSAALLYLRLSVTEEAAYGGSDLARR
ncbi:MAG: S41 family peptidase [Phycisphaerales bacterium]|nr:S41 family peptidase [Phycisphaerales bacterium]